MLLVLSVSPLFAPLFGGWLLLITSWRYLFWIQAGLAALAVVAVVLRLPESHPGSDRAIHPVAVMRDYAAIARDRRFLGYVHGRRRSPGRGFMSISPAGRMW